MLKLAGARGLLASCRDPVCGTTNVCKRLISSSPRSFSASKDQGKSNNKKPDRKDEKKPATKTMAQIDEEMRLKMEGLAGDGGESGVELENGKAVSMKRGVRDNMFRYI